MKQLEILQSVAPGLHGIGWMRNDLPMFHTFSIFKDGEEIIPSNGRGGNHWPCKVCQEHGYTEEDFNNQLANMVDKT